MGSLFQINEKKESIRLDISSLRNYNNQRANKKGEFLMSHIADLRHVFHQLEYLSEKIAKHYGVEHLAGPQGHVLHFLGDHMDKEIFVKDIETELKISKSVASNLVKRMEKNGFVQIIPSVVDKRFKQVVLTPLGQEKLQPLRDWHQEMSESLFRGIPREDFQSMIRLIHQLKENIKQYKENNDV